MLLEIHNVLTSEELNQIHKLLPSASWNSGEQSAGTSAATQKSNLEMDQNSDVWRQINQLVAGRLYQHPDFQSAVLPHRLSAAFISKYTQGMAYHTHTDDPIMGAAQNRYRSDVAITVFLNDEKTYEGGELVIHTQFGAVQTKLPAGSAVLYPASSLHEVATITQGARLAGVLWAQSLVRDPNQRQILFDLDTARQALKLSTPKAEVTSRVDQAYLNLVRMWSEV